MFADEPDRITNIHGGYPGYVGLAGSWIFFSIDLIPFFSLPATEKTNPK